jgi:RNA polymerase sigma-70 factor (ECF subfamily)
MENNKVNIDAIVKNLLKNDKKAMDDLYAFYYPRLYSFSKKILKVEDDINDILQDVFVKIWLNRKKINSVETFNSYIFTITKNAIITCFREKTRNRDYELKVRQAATGKEFIIETELEYQDLKEKVDALIEKLPEKRKQVYILSREKGLSNAEIAEQLGISVKTVEDHMMHSLKYLRDKMKNLDIVSMLFAAFFL